MPAVLGLSLSIAMGALAFERDVVGSDFGVTQLLSALRPSGWSSPWCPSRSRRSTDGGTSPRATSPGCSTWSTTATTSARSGSAILTSCPSPVGRSEDRRALGRAPRSVSTRRSPSATGWTAATASRRCPRPSWRRWPARPAGSAGSLAPMGVRYLVVIDRAAPSRSPRARWPCPTARSLRCASSST